MLKHKILSHIILICCAVNLTATAGFAGIQADVYTSVTTGKRMVVNHNIQDARQKAEKDALGTALQNAFSTLLPSQVLASNLDFFYDKILPKVKDYIITYKVLGGIENKGYYLVGVESKVDIRLLEKTLTDARIFNANKDKPVVMFFISEELPVDVEPKIWWIDQDKPYYSFTEEIIANQMTQEQFMVIGNGDQRPDPAFYNIIFRSLSDAQAAIELGRQMKVDMIIFGRAASKESMNRMGEEKAFHASVQVDGFNIETGKKVLSSQVEATVTSLFDNQGAQDAITKAANISAKDLIDKIDAYWVENLRKEHSFMVRIEGEKFHPRYLALTRRFKQMPGIENMQPKEIGSRHGVLEMFYKGSPSKFANALMLKTFDDFGFEFVEVTDEQVLIQLIEKEQEVELQTVPPGEVLPVAPELIPGE